MCNVIFVCASTQAHVHQGDAVGNVRKLGLKQRRVSENMTAAYMAMRPHVWPIIIVIIVFIVIMVIMTSDLYIMMS